MYLHEAGDHSLCRHGTCESCGGITYKGKSLCTRCEHSRAQLARTLVQCWICGKPMADRPRTAPRPTCTECNRWHGPGVCSKCDGPKRLVKPGLCRACSPVLPELSARVCELCQESYVPKSRSRPGTQQRFCSKSCTRAWQNGARPPYSKRVVVGMARKMELRRIRSQRRAETWDGVTDEQIFERDRWRCGICGKRIGKSFKAPHPRSKSIDHVVPLIEGGEDTAANKRAAHLLCNTTRGHRGGNEQLAMIG